MEQKYDHIFSVIIAVYNSAPFIRETLESILRQNIDGMYKVLDGKRVELDFSEVVEVIMVDDGSDDGSGEIIDEYAAKYPNFRSVHKKNGGVASARNKGLSLARGKYLNFLDSDDKFSENMLSAVYSFFEDNYDKTDVVSVPLRFFDAVEGEHWQNYKFRKHNRVVDLFSEYDSPLMFVNASFFKSEFKDKVFFDPRLVCGEDIKYICTVISERMTLGLVSECNYFYRRRSSGEESLIQSAKKKRGWYFDYFTYLVDWGVDFARRKWGYIPYYFQNILVCDIKWRFLNDYESTAIKLLGEDEFERYKSVLYSSLRYFDDRFILNQRSLYPEHKCMMLEKKYGCLPQKCIYPDDVRLRFGNTLFSWLSSCYTLIEFIKLRRNSLIIEGYTTILGYSEETPIRVYLRIKTPGKQPYRFIPCDHISRDSINRYKLGEMMFRAISFRCALDLSDIYWAEISVVCIAEGNMILKKDIRFGIFSPIGKEYSKSYYYNCGYLVTRKTHYLYVERCSRDELARRERAFRKELKTSNKASDNKAYYVHKAISAVRSVKKKRIWLISDRVDGAGDNGEAFFTYLSEKKPPDLDFYFVISKSSPDFSRLEKLGNVVEYASRRHKLLYLLADAIISSQADEFVISPFNKYFAPYRRFISEKRYVFLQHGVTKDDVSKWFNRYRVNLSGFVTSSESEYRSIFEYDYHYPESAVWLTGMPRFDYLYDERERIISVLPTWRAYLLDNYRSIGDKRFLDSSYFDFWKDLFSSERLREALEKYGYSLRLKPHPRMTPYLGHFTKDSSFGIYDNTTSYKEIFAKSALLLTDYSSTAMDFSYLGKPVVYAQFDREEFFSGEHTYKKGYFDYERDGFGEVTDNLEETVDVLIEYMKNDCKLKDKYRDRIDKFFKFRDASNSARVYEKIRELE